MQTLSIGCLILAAGNATRFGENKLAALFEGKPLIEYALSAVPCEAFSRIAVVTQYDEVASIAKSHHFIIIENSHPDWGISHSIRLGTAALNACDAILYQVADQPLLQRESVAAQIGLFRAHPDKIVSMSHNGVRGNPCIFPARFFPELMALEGDCGGSAVIRRHEDSLLLFEVSSAQLRDVDTPAALNALKKPIV